ncbi:MAG: polysaccharide deacetylase family protein [Candidatus Obscuribacterales bacterium]|nr:polysaccharide deacetylase family protein [Candidatus Obscuribacterales bacterium]
MSLFRLIANEFDHYADKLAVARIDLVSSVLRKVQPPGFWGEHSSERIFLTFDDGPSPHTTPALLEMLEETGTKATFFLIGQEAERYPQLVESIAQAGHSIGNHSYSHKYLPALGIREIEKQIIRTNTIVQEITGSAPEVFRPPYGMMDARVASCLGEQRLSAIYWTSAPEDWAVPGAHRVTRRVNFKLKGGGIVVLHEGKELGKQTILAAKQIIYACRDKNFELHKVESCLTSESRRITDS